MKPRKSQHTSLNNNTTDVVRDENGVYNRKGNTMVRPIVHDGVVYVRKGIQNISYSIAADPEKTVIRKIVFEEGVTKICTSWSGLYDKELQNGQKIDIILPSTIWRIQNNAFCDMVDVIDKVYIPRISAKRTKKILPYNLRSKAVTDRYFFSNATKKEWIFDPFGTFINFLIPERKRVPVWIKILCWVAILFYLINCMTYYNRTFLASHLDIDWILIGITFFIVCIINYLKSNDSINLPAIIKNILMTPVVCFVLFLSIFFINDKFGGLSQKTEGYVESINQYKPRHRKEYHRCLNISMIGTDKRAEINVGTYLGHLEGRKYAITYHKGIFGLDVIDNIDH